jgi:glucokinase
MQAPAPYPMLLADIGGTNARFACVQRAAGPITAIQSFAIADFPSPLEAIKHYRQRCFDMRLPGAERAEFRTAAIAVATPVRGDRVELTNGHWSFSTQSLRATLALDHCMVINDFEALALALPYLQPSQWQSFPGPQPRSTQETLAVIGPGTGLGVAGLKKIGGGWVALAGEGGHATLSAADEWEAQLIAWVRSRYPHVSAERLLSGAGLPLLHEAVCALSGHSGGAPKTYQAPDILDHLDRDPLCQKTMASFCALLGSFCGNVALMLGARGGVFLAGGILPRIQDFVFNSQLQARFTAKGRFEAYLADIPLALITDTYAAFYGLSAALESQLATLNPVFNRKGPMASISRAAVG